MKKGLGIVVAVLILGTVAHAGTLTFFGEDLGQGESVPLPAHPNSDAAEADFLSNLTGVGTEDFEGFTSGTSAPLAVSFGAAGTATLTGDGYVNRVTSGTWAGRYPISGDQYWEASERFGLTFSAPIAALGFYGTDIGDFSGQVELTLAGGGSKVVNIGNSTGGSGGGALFFGIIETSAADLFTSVTFGNTASGTDYFGFDDMTIGSLEQVTPAGVPLPSAAWMGLGLLGLFGAARRIRRRRS